MQILKTTKTMSDKTKLENRIKQLGNVIRTDLKMFENGLTTVGTKQNSDYWLNFMRKEIYELQTLSDQYHASNN